MVVGNGEVSMIQEMRSTPAFSYFHGLIGKDEYDSLSECCPGGDDVKGKMYCHYDEYFVSPLDYPLQPRPDLTPAELQCAENVKAVYLATAQGDDEGNPTDWVTKNDVYNIYQDCYDQTTPSFGSAAAKRRSFKYSKAAQSSKKTQKSAAMTKKSNLAVDTPTKTTVVTANLDPVSTDAQGGLQCFMNNAAESYLSQHLVRKALHVIPASHQWQFCSDAVGEVYQQQHSDMSPEMETIMNSGLNLRVLLYNGDADTACTFIEAQWFTEAFAHKFNLNETDYAPWWHRGVMAGYTQRFTDDNKGFTLDIMTLKGAGHFVPTDRPGPSLQMIGAFMRNEDYNTPIPYSLDRQPLLPQYRREGDVYPAAPTTAPTTTTTPVPTTPEDASPSSTTTTTTTTTLPPTTTSASGLSLFTALAMIVAALFF
ncbi:hypothetical protein PFISCL1PPCAC_29066 [Pristionchus fissidentatus]|uniref:Peptidase n=2 Tax=Pristionchus fissidentatus TaxID=1538716 RepID=A0AAV5X398_9BILA|nr:hypothetical protein PFISCL1PPCAC_29066 [Pristionchus fissidentatus]